MKSIKYMLMITALLITAQMASAAVITSVTARNADAAPVLGGILTDPALAWTDRNQHRIEGVPEILVNKAEYVKTTMGDKDNATLEYDIVLATDADVYLFIDKRIGDNNMNTVPVFTSAMTWVTTMGFVDTELEIGIDENFATDDDIDNWYRLYKATFPAGTVTLKQQNDTTSGDANMRAQYVIAAVSALPTAKDPIPADGQGLATDPSSSLYPGVEIDSNLSWQAPSSDKIDPAVAVQYRVFMDPNETKVIAGPTGGCEYFLDYTTATEYNPIEDLDYTKKYYWKIDTKVTLLGQTDPNEYAGPVWSFKTVAQDKAPIAQAGQSIRTWLDKAKSGTVQLQGSVLFAEDDSTAQWTAYKMPIPDAVPATEVTFTDPTSPTTTVTISATGEYVLQLIATDDDPLPGSPSMSQMKVIVYADACEAAQNTPGYAKDAYDFDGNCIVSLTDLAALAKAWLVSTAATIDTTYPGGTIGDPEQALLVEYWTDIDGTDPNAILDDERYPNNPTGSNLITNQFTQNTRNLENYGQRIRGYIVPPTTGDYIFYIASDDASRLFLSTDSTPDNAVKIAEVKGWTPIDNWTQELNQASGAQSLTADTYYYVEVLHKEGTGGDYVSVAWSTDGGTTKTVIPASALRWYLTD